MKKKPIEISLKDIETTFSNKNGLIVFTKDGFKLIGDETKIKIGDLYFQRKAGETSPESYVKIAGDRIILKGTELTKEGFVRVASTTEEFVVNFGSYQSLARETSFKDIDGRLVRFRIDNQGRVSAVSREGVNEGRFIPLSQGIDSETSLSQIYKNSGATVKELIKDSKNYYDSRNEIFGIENIKAKFYSDNELKKSAQEIKTDVFEPNFLSIGALSLELGGRGKIEVLRDLTGITAINPNKFTVKVGDMNLKFDDNGVHYQRMPVKNSFNIEDISVIKNGRISGDSFTITGNDKGEKIVEKSRIFVAGRESLIQGNGMAADAHLDVARESLDKIRKRIESKWGTEFNSDVLASTMMDSEFAVKIDAFIPTDVAQKIFRGELGILAPNVRTGTIPRELIASIYKGVLKPRIDEKLNKIIPIDGQEYIAREETKKQINELIRVNLENVNEIDLRPGRGGFTIGFQNNPGGNPYLLLGLPNQEVKRIPLTDTPGGAQTATFARNLLEASVRAPLLERGEVTSYRFSSFSGKPSQYWPRNYLRRLWYQNLGKGSDQWDRLLGPGDAKFFESENGIINTYLEKKKK